MDKDPRIEYLNKLQQAAEAVCREAYRNRHLIDDAVNWADLHCHEAKYCIDQYGHEYYEVVIEEAAPDANKLRAYIDNTMKRHGYDVVVITEW